MDALLKQCDENLRTMSCCHADGRRCYCFDCLYTDFHARLDEYDCKKKANAYVLNYGLSYASEIYYYLQCSKIIEKNFNARTIKVLSLGCGFAPDLFALTRYVIDNKLQVGIEYHGVDLNDSWQTARYNTAGATFRQGDVTQNIDLAGFDLIFVVKLFSTLFKHSLHTQFLAIFEKEAKNQLGRKGLCIFNDINSINMGRDVLQMSIMRYLNINPSYFFDTPWRPPRNWTRIPQKGLVFSVPSGISKTPLDRITNTFFFECRK